MGIRIREITKYIEGIAPLNLAEEWDNVGLMVGSMEQEVKRILVCLDVTSKVVEEAISKKADLIVSHHPFLFKGMKRITEDDIKGQLIFKLIKFGIGVYSAHTNLDVTVGGINETLASLIGLTGIRNLNKYKEEKCYKIAVFVPLDHADKVRAAMCDAGAGWIGNYSDCTFMTKGTGTFKPLEGTNPYVGAEGSLEKVEEIKIETLSTKDKLQGVLNAMHEAHPYEEVAYDVYSLEKPGVEYGLGKVGELSVPMGFKEFVEELKKKLALAHVRVIGSLKGDVKRVAVFCGSFDGNFSGVIKGKADLLVTGDLKYHPSVDAEEMGLCIIDAGHFGTERIIVPKIVKWLSDKFVDIEVMESKVEADPFKTI
ncbi:MAG: Nif3-like dinuclear metal center hexameric protein [Clostridia bacterium]|nr:Nif3-like dinuclear metal center hexameric protein [Clostridia bacterium]